MKNFVEEFFRFTFGFIFAAILISFFFSGFRTLVGGNCQKLNIDSFEPAISTRWFCEKL